MFLCQSYLKSFKTEFDLGSFKALNTKTGRPSMNTGDSGIILCMRPANERQRYIVTSLLIGWAHPQIIPSDCLSVSVYTSTIMSPHVGFFHHSITISPFNTLRPRQNGRHLADDIFNCIFLNENVWILIKISLKFVPKDPINNITALVQIMAWRRPGDKPLSEPMMINFLTHICVTRPQWVNPILFQSCLILSVFCIDFINIGILLKEKVIFFCHFSSVILPRNTIYYVLSE